MSRFNEIVAELEKDPMYKDRKDPVAREALLMHAQVILDDEQYDPHIAADEAFYRQGDE